MKNKKTTMIVLNILLILFTSSCITKMVNNDVFFTIANGNHILENGLSSKDSLTWHQDLDFPQFRWLFDILISIIYQFSNFTGIYVFTILVSCLIAIFLFYVLNKKSNNLALSFGLTLISIYLSSQHGGLTSRAQIVSYLLLLLEVYFIEQLIQTNHKRYLPLLFIVSTLTANFHATVWLMSLILLFPYLVDIVLGKFIKHASKISFYKDANIKRFLLGVFVVALGGICNPNGFITYTYMYKNSIGLPSTFITEMLPITLTNYPILLSFIVIFISLLIFTNTKVKLSDILLFFGLSLAAHMYSRNQFFLYLIAIIPFCRLLSTFIEHTKLNKFSQFFNGNLYKPLSLITLFFFLVSISFYNFSERIEENFVDNSSCPVEASNYIHHNIDISNLRIFNGYNLGSYLEFSGIPAFMDPRYEVFAKEFNDTDILKDWLAITQGLRHYEEIFTKYHINYVLLYNTELIQTYLYSDPNYQKVYQDDTFCLYQKIS